MSVSQILVLNAFLSLFQALSGSGLIHTRASSNSCDADEMISPVQLSLLGSALSNPTVYLTSLLGISKVPRNHHVQTELMIFAHQCIFPRCFDSQWLVPLTTQQFEPEMWELSWPSHSTFVAISNRQGLLFFTFKYLFNGPIFLFQAWPNIKTFFLIWYQN